MQIQRHKTALRRFDYSRPIALAMTHGIISTSVSIFDYGCGRGQDVELLNEAGFRASGWDPHFRPGATIKQADCINLGYVLNVIEDLVERQDTLRRAYDLAQKVLIVSVRVDQALHEAVEFGDGYLTKVGSFQKLYAQSEFKDYLYAVLGRKPHMASLGIAYVFKDDQAEAEYLARLSLYRPQNVRQQAIEQFAADRIAKQFVSLSRELGRLPLSTEFKPYSKLIDRFGSPQRVERLTTGLLDWNTVSERRERKRENFLTYMAMLSLQAIKSPPLRTLPAEVQADIKMLWPSYAAAVEESQRFLFQLGNPEIVKQHCHSASVGKKLPEDLYVHRSAEEQLSALLRLVIFAAKQIVGDVEYDIIKMAVDGRKLSFLKYGNFDEVGHPELQHSIRVFLPKATYSVRNYNDSSNPPILHRKEAFIDPLHPRYAEFAALSLKEEERGLLSRTDIGTRNGWAAALAEAHLRVQGHSLVESSTSLNI